MRTGRTLEVQGTSLHVHPFMPRTIKKPRGTVLTSGGFLVVLSANNRLYTDVRHNSRTQGRMIQMGAKSLDLARAACDLGVMDRRTFNRYERLCTFLIERADRRSWVSQLDVAAVRLGLKLPAEMRRQLKRLSK